MQETDYIGILKKYILSGSYSHSEKDNQVFSETYEDLLESLSYENLSRVNNLFILLTGISLETLFDSDNPLSFLQDNYRECINTYII